jgi:hypothetical protein
VEKTVDMKKIKTKQKLLREVQHYKEENDLQGGWSRSMNAAVFEMHKEKQGEKASGFLLRSIREKKSLLIAKTKKRIFTAVFNKKTQTSHIRARDARGRFVKLNKSTLRKALKNE